MVMRRLTRQSRFFVRLAKAFIKRHFSIIFLGSLLGILAFFLLPRFFGNSSKPETIRIGLVGRFSEELIPEEIAQLTSLGFTKLKPEGTATSSLAKLWEVTDEGKVYKFYLRDDIIWQDGTKFTAKDIPYEFKNAKIEATSDFQIRITLKEPFSALPVLVSKPIFKRGIIGVGDYRIEKLERSGRFLEKMTLVAVNKGTLPNYTYRFYPTEEAARIGFKLGEVDILKRIVNFSDLAIGNKIIATVHKDRYAAVFFNLKKAKFEEKSFRQALAYGIKKEDGERRAFGPINPSSWAYNYKLKPYPYNLARSKELLGQEEHEDSIDLVAFPSLMVEAEKIKENWQALGIKTEVKIINQLPDDFEALLAVWEIPVDPDQYSIWHSTQISNITGVANPKIDKLLEEGRKTFDQEKRKEIYQEFQKTLVEECPAIFLFHPVTYTVTHE